MKAFQPRAGAPTAQPPSIPRTSSASAAKFSRIFGFLLANSGITRFRTQLRVNTSSSLLISRRAQNESFARAAERIVRHILLIPVQVWVLLIYTLRCILLT